PGVLPHEPRAHGERGPEPDHPGLPRGVHEGAPDGVRHRVQPPREARDGGLARVTEVADPSTVAAPRTRPARSGPQDLTYRLDAALVEGRTNDEPSWLA